MIELWTDGSSRGNPGDGGFAVIVVENGAIIQTYKDFFEDVTNNQMELRAILKALELTQSVYKECACKIISDSAYCVNTYNKWIEGWAANNWMRNKVDPVKNLELMKQLYSYKQINTPNFIIEKTAGHVGYVFNELADAAATGNRKKWNDTILQYKIPDISAVKNLPY